MATLFEVKFCLSASCTGLKLIDTTGFWSTENPFGYWNSQNGDSPDPALPTLTINGTFGYDSYSVNIWEAVQGGVDLNATPQPPPDWTFDLLTLPHTIDVDTGYVTWDLSLETLGLSYLYPGWWIARGDAVWTDTNDEVHDYPVDCTSGISQYLTEQVDKMMLASSPEQCECKKGCQSPYELLLLYNPISCWAGNSQDYAGYQRICDFLFTSLPLCPC